MVVAQWTWTENNFWSEKLVLLLAKTEIHSGGRRKENSTIGLLVNYFL
jgi:hypothetical protein